MINKYNKNYKLTKKEKLMIRILIYTVFNILLILFTCSTYANNEEAQPTMNITKAQWKEDIRYYAEHIRKGHLNLFHTLSEEEFEREVYELLEAVDELTSVQITAELIRITQRIGDGHTSVSRINFSTRYPIKVKIYGDKYIIIATDENHKNMLGGQLTHIGGMPIAEVSKLVTPYTTNVENEWSWRQMVVRSITRSQLLHSLNIVKNALSTELTYIDQNAIIQNKNIAAISDADYQNIEFQYAAKNKPPYLRKPKNSALDGLWFSELPDEKTAYIRFDSYPSMAEMERFSESLANYIDEHKLSRMVFDLRGNGGGDFYVGIKLSQPLVMLSSIDWLNGVFVITGRKTFSAAMSNAAQYKQMLNARLIGEPTGADPLGYQELGIIKLPNSKRNVYHSKRIFRFQDKNTEGIQPDIFIAPSWQHEIAGRDPVIEWLLAH